MARRAGMGWCLRRDASPSGCSSRRRRARGRWRARRGWLVPQARAAPFLRRLTGHTKQLLASCLNKDAEGFSVLLFRPPEQVHELALRTERVEPGIPHQRRRAVHPAIHYSPQDVERELRVTDIRHVARPKQQSLRVVKTSRLHLPGSSNACLLVTLKCCELGLEIPMLGALRFV